MARKPHPRKLPGTKIRAAVPVDTVYINPLFKLVLLALLVIFGVLLGLSVRLSGDDTPNDLQKQLFAYSTGGCELILGAIIGLLGGKAIDSFAQKIDVPK